MSADAVRIRLEPLASEVEAALPPAPKKRGRPKK